MGGSGERKVSAKRGHDQTFGRPPRIYLFHPVQPGRLRRGDNLKRREKVKGYIGKRQASARKKKREKWQQLAVRRTFGQFR